MDKGKIIPLVLAAILIAVAGIIFYYNLKNNKSFEMLIVAYKSEKNEYKNLKVDDVIVVNNVSFWVVSIEKEVLVLNSSDELLDSDEKQNEFKITIGKDKNICFSADNCATFRLS